MKKEFYYLIVENTCDVFMVGEFAGLQDAKMSVDIDHFSHGEPCILIPQSMVPAIVSDLAGGN